MDMISRMSPDVFLESDRPVLSICYVDDKDDHQHYFFVLETLEANGTAEMAVYDLQPNTAGKFYIQTKKVSTLHATEKDEVTADQLAKDLASCLEDYNSKKIHVFSLKIKSDQLEEIETQVKRVEKNAEDFQPYKPKSVSAKDYPESRLKMVDSVLAVVDGGSKELPDMIDGKNFKEHRFVHSFTGHQQEPSSGPECSIL